MAAPISPFGDPAGEASDRTTPVLARKLSKIDSLLDEVGRVLSGRYRIAASGFEPEVLRKDSDQELARPERAGPSDLYRARVLADDCQIPQNLHLAEEDRRLAGALMRVNHVGEVCAQALYRGQAAGTHNQQLKGFFVHAAAEELRHLAWTQQRLDELKERPSALDPLWYIGSYCLGLLAARMGDARSLGFMVETERQVEEHLAGHMDRLPAADAASRAIVSAMKDDEVAHGSAARRLGAAELPLPLKWAMRLAARVMTTTAYRI